VLEEAYDVTGDERLLVDLTGLNDIQRAQVKDLLQKLDENRGFYDTLES
jgi:hypothetical protein